VTVCGDVGSCLVEACGCWTYSLEVSLVYDPCDGIWLTIGDNDSSNDNGNDSDSSKGNKELDFRKVKTLVLKGCMQDTI
jgi:hypothetical protein